MLVVVSYSPMQSALYGVKTTMPFGVMGARWASNFASELMVDEIDMQVKLNEFGGAQLCACPGVAESSASASASAARRRVSYAPIAHRRT